MYRILRSPIDKKSKENSAVTVEEKTFLKECNEDQAEKQICTVESEESEDFLQSRLVTFSNIRRKISKQKCNALSSLQNIIDNWGGYVNWLELTLGQTNLYH